MLPLRASPKRQLSLHSKPIQLISRNQIGSKNRWKVLRDNTKVSCFNNHSQIRIPITNLIWWPLSHWSRDLSPNQPKKTRIRRRSAISSKNTMSSKTSLGLATYHSSWIIFNVEIVLKRKRIFTTKNLKRGQERVWSLAIYTSELDIYHI